MATRALIGKIKGDKVRYICNQNDGYVEHLGKTLLKHYRDSSRVDSLLDLGDINYLHLEFIANRVGGEGYFYLWDTGHWWACLDEERGWYPLSCNDIKYLIDYYENFLMKKYGRA